MRTLNALVCLSLCNLLSACGDDSVAPPTDDGGGNGGNEVGGAASSAGGAESTGGSASGGAEVGGAGPVGSPVAVTVRDYQGEAVEGLDVIANDETGALVDAAKTDDLGLAELTVPANGSVSVLHENDYGSSGLGALARNVETMVFGETPPEAVAFNILVAHEPEPAGPTMTLDTWYSPHSGASTYQLMTSCGSSGEVSTAGIVLTIPGCTESGVFDAVLIARDASGTVLDHARLDDQAFVPGSYSTKLMTWIDAPTAYIPFVLSGIPSGGAVYGSSVARQRESGRAASIVASHPLEPAVGLASFTMQHMPSYGNEHCQEATIRISTGEASKHYLRRRCGAVADLSSFSVNAEHLTRFDPAAPALAPHVLHWDAGADAALGDVLLVEQLWYRSEDVTGTWSVYLAPSVRDVVFPELPEGRSAFAYQGSDVFSNTKIAHRDYADVDGFEAAAEKGLPELSEVSVEEYFSLFGD